MPDTVGDHSAGLIRAQYNRQLILVMYWVLNRHLHRLNFYGSEHPTVYKLLRIKKLSVISFSLLPTRKTKVTNSALTMQSVPVKCR